MKSPLILYFVHGPVPSEADKEAAAKYPFPVGFRNVDHIGEFFTPEPCDGVDGDVPEQYRKFPTGAEAVAKFKEDFDNVRQDIADTGMFASVGTIDPELAPKTSGTTGKPGFNTNRIEDEGTKVVDKDMLTREELTENLEEKGKVSAETLTDGDGNKTDATGEKAPVDSGNNPEVEKKAATKAGAKAAAEWKPGK